MNGFWKRINDLLLLYLECDLIPEVVENEDDLNDVPVAGHEGKF